MARQRQLAQVALATFPVDEPIATALAMDDIKVELGCEASWC